MIAYRVTYTDLISQTTHDVGFADKNMFIFTLETLKASSFIEIITIEGMTENEV